MKRIACVVVAAAAWGSIVAGQDSDPVVSAARRLVSNYARRMPAAVDAMPADKFQSRPTPGHEEFSHLVAHMVNFNTSRCAFISGSAPAAELKADEPRENLVAALKSSFEFCTGVLAKLRDSDLGQEGAFSPTRKASKAELLLHIVGTEYDHYAQAANYLRAAGVKFPIPN